MKRLLILSLLLLATGSSLLALGTSKAILFADSFMLRAQGTEALYYNPALINPDYTDVMLPAVNVGFFISNNSLNLDTYNFVMSRDYLSENDKAYLMNRLEPSMEARAEGHVSLFGLTVGNVGLASSFHLYGKGALSREYVRLLLYGNEDSLYVFDKKDNHASILSFADITFGMGDINIPLPENWNTSFKVGFSGSLLVGLGDAYTHRFEGSFASGFDGLALSQDLEMHTGVGGAGFKALLGAVAEPLPDLKLGLTLDNILGSIGWGVDTQAYSYSFQADSIYVANLEDDFFQQETTDYDIENYSTKLPLELRLAALYQLGDSSLSADWVLPVDGGITNTGSGELSVGAEVNPFKHFPIHLGFKFGNSANPASLSLGAGIETSYGDLGLGFQSYDSLIPGPSSKGISIGTYFNFKI